MKCVVCFEAVQIENPLYQVSGLIGAARGRFLNEIGPGSSSSLTMIVRHCSRNASFSRSHFFNAAVMVNWLFINSSEALQKGVPRLFDVQHFFNSGNQFISIKRFFQKVIGAHPQCFLQDGILIADRVNQHGNILGDRVSLQLLEELQTIHVRQHQIEKNHIRHYLPNGAESLSAASGDMYLISLRLQVLPAILAAGRAVIGNQDDPLIRGFLN